MAIASVITCIYKPLSHPTIYFPTHHRSSFHVSFPNYLSFSDSPAPQLAGNLTVRRTRRATSVVTRAGPSTNTYIFAFVFPLSLLAITIFAAMRIGDRLDQKFLEELAINQATRELDDDEDEASEMFIPREEEPAVPRTRNRPKREV